MHHARILNLVSLESIRVIYYWVAWNNGTINSSVEARSHLSTDYCHNCYNEMKFILLCFVHNCSLVHFYITSAMTSYIPTCWKGNFYCLTQELTLYAFARDFTVFPTC